METTLKKNDKYEPDEIKILAGLYLSIMSNGQCKRLFNMIDLARKTYIEGTMPFGEHLYYCNEAFLTDDMIDELKTLDRKGALMYHMIVIKLARHIFQQEGVR